jgi:hypothetical protein
MAFTLVRSGFNSPALHHSLNIGQIRRICNE